MKQPRRGKKQKGPTMIKGPDRLVWRFRVLDLAVKGLTPEYAGRLFRSYSIVNDIPTKANR